MLRFNKYKLAQAFDRFYQEASSSKSYLKFCYEVSGIQTFQFNLMDLNQISLIFENTKFDTNSRILDLGCGPGFLTDYLFGSLNAEVIGLDFSSLAIEMGQSNFKEINFLKGSIEKPPFKKEKFSHIFAFDSLYGLGNMPRLILKWKKYLTPEGVFLIFHNNIEGKSLGKELQRYNIDFCEVDITNNFYDIIKKSQVAIDKLKVEFEAEGKIWPLKTKQQELIKLKTLVKHRGFYLIKGE